MSIYSIPHLGPQDSVTATLYVAWLAAIERSPHLWRWPASTRAYLRLRVADLAAGLVADGATVAEVAA